MKRALADLADPPRFGVRLPERATAVAAAEAIAPNDIEVEIKEPDDLDEIADRVALAFQAGHPPGRRDLKHAPLCLWDGARPLARRPGGVDGLLDHVSRSGRKSLFRRLAATYVIKFPFGDPSLMRVADTLRVIAGDYVDTWSAAADALSLFDPARAPGIIAGIALETGRSPTDVLASHGIRGLATESKLCEAAFLAGISQICESVTLSPAARLASIRAWGFRADGTLLFPQHRGPLADALVLPYADVDPPAIVNQYLDFLLKAFRDPRVGSENWGTMACTPIVLRWLTTLTLRQFLDVVDGYALESHWKYRRKFWEAVNNRRLISDAWVAFDGDGAFKARRIFGANTQYARLHSSKRKRIERGHAVLLLKIGNGIVAEWSQNGICNIWHDAHDDTAPKWRRQDYTADEVRLIDDTEILCRHASIKHDQSERYYWQSDVANQIFDLTGVRITPSEYRI